MPNVEAKRLLKLPRPSEPAAQHDQLVGHGAEARLVGVHRRLRVMKLLEAHDLAVLADLGEQLAAFRDLLDELVPADGLPLALAALAGALQGVLEAVGMRVDLLGRETP